MGSIRFVPLGDSYTIGTSVAEAERWPNQLVARLANDPVSLHLVANPAVNGFASGDLIRVELPKLDNLRPEFVTVQIGVNDVVQGVADVDYSANASLLLDTLLEVLAAERLLCLATPTTPSRPRKLRSDSRRPSVP